MKKPVSRVLRPLLASIAILGLISGLSAKPSDPPAPIAVKPIASSSVPWLYKNSDIPVDKAWTFGELQNGVRYAVRNNGVPPGQVSIRVAIDAGSLMEKSTELGFAHFNEHLSFRGSKYVSEGEAKKVWQRLGASFGSDTNAATSNTQTVYKLDLPRATDEGMDETFKILSGMMAAATLTQAEVDAERRTVLAELREGDTPGERVSDERQKLLFAGQPLGNHPTIGTIETLNAATPATLRAFRDRWYRPSNAVISVSGDVAPEKIVALIRKYFSEWKGVGTDIGSADFGTPKDLSPRTRFLHTPATPTSIQMLWARPWEYKADTIKMNQGRLVEMLATFIVNRRLETRARAGGSYVSAQIDSQDIARSLNGTFVAVTPVGDNWQAALSDVRGVLADAMTRAPTQDEINRETAEIVAVFEVSVENSSVQTSARQADDIVEAVNIRETVASPAVARDVFTALKGQVTPAQILEASKKLFTGVGPRVFVTSKAPLADGDAKLAALMATPVKPIAFAAGKNVTIDQLPKFGAPGTIVSESEIPRLETKVLKLSNGVTAMLSSSPYESGRIFVQARFGYGRQSFPKSRISPAWAAPYALVQSGIGDLSMNDIDRMTTGLKVGLEFEVGDDAFILRGTTRPADLSAQMKLIAAKLGTPGWDPAPLNRAKSGYTIASGTWTNSPKGIIDRELEALLHGGDKRWVNPSATEANALTPQAFRAFWEPLLTQGPLEVSIFGDFDMQKTTRDLLATFGALPSRKPLAKAPGAAFTSGPVANAAPLVRLHSGNPEQAAAMLAWPTSAGLNDSYESRVLDILAQIYTDRMFEQFREEDGASYSPSVFSQWPTGLDSGGSFVVLSQIKPDGVDKFFKRTKSIATALATAPVSDDELKRAVGPAIEQFRRATSGKYFWMLQLSGATTDPRKIDSLRSWWSDLERITPADLQAAAKKYLVSSKGFSMVILPQKKK